MTGPDDAAPMPADALWAFAVALYGRPGVSAACLVLQDREGIDVCLLLASLWAGSVGRRADREARVRLRAVAWRWNTAAVAPVRAARRALRQPEHRTADAVKAAADDAARRIAEIERSLERSELGELAVIIAAMPRARPSPALARRHARRIAGCRDRTSLRVIVHSVFGLR